MSTLTISASPLRVQVRTDYLIEPAAKGPTVFWEGHHTTNPCVVRLSRDPRVFLGYRAGGPTDWFRTGPHTAWGSYLGLAILDASGERVMHRLPLPIMRFADAPSLPRSEADSAAYAAGPHRDTICVLHDFRFWEDGEWLYVIYHEGTVTEVFDCIVRMKSEEFLRRVEASLAVLHESPGELGACWRKLWWEPGIWHPAGINGTNRIYGSRVTKNDIVFIRTLEGSVRMLHRPLPDIGIVDTGGATHAPLTADGIAAFGVLQSCIRPGFADNSHIGNNGTPTMAQIGDVPIYFDIVHGVGNRRVTERSPDGGWQLKYLPYLRILDRADGSVLYYAEEPMLDEVEAWKRYTVEGVWVKSLPHLDSVMFAGGQIEAEAGRNGLNDLFHVYMGVGDTAVALASFRLRDLLPPKVVADILGRDSRRFEACEWHLHRKAVPGRAAGWDWHLVNVAAERDIAVERKLPKETPETEQRRLGLRPGYFDAHGLHLAEMDLQPVGDWAWLVAYHGLRWEEENGRRFTVAGLGLLLLDRDNPERVLYRSSEPVPGSCVESSGWVMAEAASPAGDLVAFVPERVRVEGEYLYRQQPMPSAMTRWLKEKSALTAGT